MKHILIFSLFYFPKSVGGAEIAIKEITDRIKDDYRFSMITLKSTSLDKKEELIGNVSIYRIGFVPKIFTSLFVTINKYIYPVLAFLKTLEIYKKDKFDLIWSMMASYNAFGAWLVKNKYKEIPFLLTLQEGDPISHIKRRALIVWPVFKQIFKKAECIQVISNFLGDFAKEMNPQAKVILVPNGVDLDLFDKKISKKEIAEMRNRLGYEDNDLILVTTSRLVYKNGIDTVIKALPNLSLNYKFLIIGNGNLYNELNKLTNNLSLKDRVRFLGFVDYNELPSYLKISDFFIRPSRSEGFGNSFIEAMASKIPVLATREGGIVDFLFDKKTGFVIEANNPESIVTQLNYIKNNPQRLNDVLDEAYNMVFKKYSWEKVASQMVECFQKTESVLKSE